MSIRTESSVPPRLGARRAALAIALGIMTLTSGCSRREPPPSGVEHTPLGLIAVTEGLRPAHARAAPLLEKVAFIPAADHGAPGSRVASRVYSDGAYYTLVSELSGAPVSPRWSYLSSVGPGGVSRLEALFAELCGETDKIRANDSGSVNYLVTSARCTHRFVVGLPSEGSRIVEVDTIINQTLLKIPPGP